MKSLSRWTADVRIRRSRGGLSAVTMWDVRVEEVIDSGHGYSDGKDEDEVEKVGAEAKVGDDFEVVGVVEIGLEVDGVGEDEVGGGGWNEVWYGDDRCLPSPGPLDGDG